MRGTFSRVGRRVVLLLLVVAGAAASARGEELTPDQAAMMVLDSARRAYNEGKYDFAVQRFREFLAKSGGHKEAPWAHYGLALALLEAPQRDYRAIIQSLQPIVGLGDFPDRPLALYYMGVAQRGTGYQALAQAAANPNEAAGHLNAAKQQFVQAAQQFAAAADAFAARAKAVPDAEAARRKSDLDWAACARCDQSEALLRTEKFKEAADLAGALLADAATQEGRYRDLATYLLGYAKFALKEYVEAGRALSSLAPFKQDFGGHAIFLLARTHHLAGERPEAAAQYKAALADYEARKKAAQAALGNPQALRPQQREFLQALVHRPPDYLVRAVFYAALLQAEEGRFADAVAGFATIVDQHPKSPLVAEARLRRGYCQMQLKDFPKAIADLTPLREHPELADRALWWLARSQVGAADPKNEAAYKQVLATAVETLRRAAERAGARTGADPDARVRRADILMELADTQRLAGQYAEAAATYHQVSGDKNAPDRAEEATQRQVTALHLAGQYAESDRLCRTFEQTYPKSTLLPGVLFRYAENAYLAATKAADAPEAAARQAEANRLFDETLKRYDRLIKQYPEFPHVNLARQAMATVHYRVGQYPEAAAVLGAIPEAERQGPLAKGPYLLADCVIRGLPAEADDAIQAARLIDQTETAVKLLEAYVSSQGENPQTADAMLKLGHCYQRIAAVLADPAERQKRLALARGAYDRAMPHTAKDPIRQAVAVFERAKCLVLLGDSGTAANEFGRFQGDPLRGAPVAPLALARLSTLLRARGKAADAVNVLAQGRAFHEPNLLKDPDRRDWVPMLQYEHALALKESGKRDEALALFDALAKQFADRPEATDAVWRAAQCRREDLAGQLDAARQAAAKPGAKPEEVAAATQAMQAAVGKLHQIIAPLNAQVEVLRKKSPTSESHLRMLYELAWCHRVLAQAETEAARQKLERDALERARAKLAKNLPAGETLPPLAGPEVPLSAVPAQPSEKTASYHYGRLIAAAPESSLAIQARLELAEMDAERGNSDSALELLADALANNLPAELAEQIRLRLAASFLARDDAKSALAQAEAVQKNAKSPFAAEARYLAGEAYAGQKNWAKAIEQLTPFRDQPPLHNVRGVSDRALLRLGYAYAQAGQWGPSRQALEILCQRYANSPWVEEARYGVGWAMQNVKEYDAAVNVYVQVTRHTAAEVAARAQLQIGLCRLAQKRYDEAIQALLVVPHTYDYPQWHAQAWCEAAQAHLAKKETAEAASLLQRVVKDYPKSEWADVARQRLAQIKQGTG